MADQGTFIVLEGADGAGKGTQFRLLHQRLEAVGYEVAVFDFPQYDKPSSHFVRRYLNGEYGPAANISPYTASLFYALDRYEAAPEIKQALADGKVVLANRFVGSNMAHMGSKIEDPIEQRSFFVWEDSLEFQLLGLPRPTLNIFLHVPAEVSYELIAKKASREYTAKSRDEHEADMEHLKKAVSTYGLLCQLFPNDFVPIDCMMGNKILSVAEINDRIWSLIKPYLPTEPKNKAHSVTLKINGEQVPSKTQPKKQPQQQTFNKDFGTVTLDLLGQIEALDRSLVDYDLDWAATNFAYLELEGLKKNTQAAYDDFMKGLVTLYKKTKKPAAKMLIPGGAKLKAKFHLNANAGALVEMLASVDSHEARQLHEKMLKSGFSNERPSQALKAKADGKPEQLGHIMSKLAKDGLNSNISADTELVHLVEALPRNEFKLLADIVYPYSELSIAEIELNLDKWSYQQKAETLQAAILDHSKALDKASYRFDILVDRLALHQLLKSGSVSEAKLQTASPRFGYDLPPTIGEEETSFEEYFDKSLELFSSLQSAKAGLAPLAVLAGHRLRANVLINLDGFSKLKSEKILPDEPIALISERISEVHPIIGASLNKEPAPEPQTPKKPSRSRKRRGNRKKT